MAQTTVYTCDICKQSKSVDGLAKIKIETEGILIKGYNRYAPLKIDICKECLKKKGFYVESKPEEIEQSQMHNAKTLEDKIYEILEDLGVAFVE